MGSCNLVLLGVTLAIKIRGEYFAFLLYGLLNHWADLGGFGSVFSLAFVRCGGLHS